MVRIDNILSFWLKNTPDWTGEFVVWILIFNLINSSLCDPIWQGMQAIGKLKKFVLIGSIVYLIAFPITWITFKYDSSPLLAFQILVYIRLAYFMVTIHIFKNYIYFTYRNYILSVIVPIIKVVIISTTITVAIDRFLPKKYNSHFIITKHIAYGKCCYCLLFRHQENTTSNIDQNK